MAGLWDSFVETFSGAAPANDTEAFWKKAGQQYGPGYATSRRVIAESGDVPLALRNDLPDLPADLVQSLSQLSLAPPEGIARGLSPSPPTQTASTGMEGEAGTPEAVPASLIEPGPITQALAMRKANAPRAAATTLSTAKVAAPVSDNATVEEPKNESTNVIGKLLGERRSQYADERDKALADAKSQENLSDTEKIAYALLGILPGLAGLVGGGIAGGGLGAAAGLAGGLQGGAQGMQTIAQGKDAKRKEFLAQAEKANDRIAKTGDQELSRAEEVANQGFTSGQAEKGRQFSAQQNDKEMAARSKEGALNRGNALQLKRMDLFGDYQQLLHKAQATSKENKMSEQQERTLILLPTMQQANKVASALENNPDLPQKHAIVNALNGVVPEGMKSDSYKAYRNPATLWTGSYLFKVSGAAVPETEIERYSKGLFAQPGDSRSEIEKKQHMRNSIEQVMSSTLNRAPQDVQAALLQAGVPPNLATYGASTPTSSSQTVDRKQRYGF